MLSGCLQRFGIAGWFFLAICLLFADVARVDAQVPAPWTASDVGAPSLTGTTTYNSGTFTVSASGVMGTRNDQFQFVYQALTTNTTLVARLASLTPADPDSRVGLMVRASLARNAAYGAVQLNGAGQVIYARRRSGGGRTTATFGQGRTAPTWVAIQREGTTITTYQSTDGRTWQTIAADTIAIGSTPLVGIAVSSNVSTLRALAEIGNVSFSGGSTTTTNTLPDNQVAIDLGSPSPAGSTTQSSGAYTITAGGADIWGTTDQFHFVYRQFTGDVDIRARVNSLQAIDSYSKAGVMIRGALTANAPYAYAFISGSSGSTFEWRLATGAASSGLPYTPGAAPTWVRLVRVGTRIESFRSADGQSWTRVDAMDVTLPSTFYVGMAVTSHRDGTATTAELSNLSVAAPTATTNGAPTVSLTAPTNGATGVAPASFTLAANASDPENRLSRVDFLANGTVIGSDSSAPFGMAWSSVPAGSYTLTARVYDLDGGSGQSSNSIGVTVTSPAPNAPPTVTLSSPTAGQTFVPPASITVAATASDPEGRMARVDFFANNQAIGSDTTSPYSVTWGSVAAGSYNITAIAVDAEGLQTTSSAVAITVRSSTTNLPPVVSITSPTNGQVFGAGSNVLLTASAADPEGRLARVEFYRGNALLGTATASPYSILWMEPATGPHDVYAAAYDVEGLRAESLPVSLTISTTGVITTNGSWSINFTASVDHATNVASYQLNIYTYGANPSTALPLATSDLGKPTPDAQSNIAVDRTTFINALATGSYTATVTAIGPGGSAQSQPTSFTR